MTPGTAWTAAGGPPVTGVGTRIYRVPTDEPEADGTATWDDTVAVVVTVTAGEATGLGWTYGDPAVASVVDRTLERVVVGSDAMDVPGCHEAMRRALRNAGRVGIGSHAIAAVDIALWDLKARLLDLPLAALLGATRTGLPAYGSGGFTSYADGRLRAQCRHWVDDLGVTMAKIKVGESRGSAEGRDLARTRVAQESLGPEVALFVDANGGYALAQARRMGAAYDDLGVTWFEEPVTSQDVRGLGTVRDAVRADVAAGEYCYDPSDADPLVGVVDCLQLDATRCQGFSGFLRAADLAATHHLDVSAHCAPALSAVVGAAVPNLRHCEYFHDHERCEPMLFDGVPGVRDGLLAVPLDGPGHGMALAPRADRYRVA